MGRVESLKLKAWSWKFKAERRKLVDQELIVRIIIKATTLVMMDAQAFNFDLSAFVLIPIHHFFVSIDDSFGEI